MRTSIAELGWDEGWDAAWSQLPAALAAEPGVVPGRVSRLDRGWVTVLGLGEEPLRVPTMGEDITTGDWVAVEPSEPKLVAVLPRRGAFARRSSDGSATAHVLAANVDTVLLVHSLSTPPNPRRLERELVLAFASGAQPVVVLTKTDLVSDADRSIAAVTAHSEGVPVVGASAVTGEGLDTLRALAGGHRTVALLGASGVGKSTLINALVGSEVQRTAEVRAFDQKGRHTTTAATLIPLPGGGLLVDTPGLRAIALWDAGGGLDRAFADVTRVAEGCWFANCRHDTEPDCAVREALAAGTLEHQRVTSWQHLHAELDALRAELLLRQKADTERARRSVSHPGRPAGPRRG